MINSENSENQYFIYLYNRIDHIGWENFQGLGKFQFYVKVLICYIGNVPYGH